MKLSLIAAASENDVIGVANTIPWRLPNDLKFFRKVTSGHPVIMGRKTFESIGRPLPDRRNIVVTRQKNLELAGCDTASSLEEALEIARKDDENGEAFVIGGGEIYKQALPLADRVYLTRVHTTLEGDAFFPSLSPQEWEEVSRDERQPDERHSLAYSFLVYDRRK